MADYSDLNPSILKPGLTTPDGANLKPGLVTPSYKGGTPTAADEVKPGLVYPDGTLREGLVGPDGNLKAGLTGAVSLTNVTTLNNPAGSSPYQSWSTDNISVWSQRIMEWKFRLRVPLSTRNAHLWTSTANNGRNFRLLSTEQLVVRESNQNRCTWDVSSYDFTKWTVLRIERNLNMFEAFVNGQSLGAQDGVITGSMAGMIWLFGYPSGNLFEGNASYFRYWIGTDASGTPNMEYIFDAGTGSSISDTGLDGFADSDLENADTQGRTHWGQEDTTIGSGG